MKTLYININGEDVQSTDSMIVIGDERDAIIDSFYIALGEEITAGSHVRGINHKAIVTDFAKDKPDAFEAILGQWEEVKEILLSDEPSGEYTISFPSDYLHWLRYNSNPAYTDVYEKKFIGHKDVKAIINIEYLYEDSVDTIRRKVIRYLQRGENASDIDEFVINDECITRKSKIVRDIRNKYDITIKEYLKDNPHKAIIDKIDSTNCDVDSCENDKNSCIFAIATGEFDTKNDGYKNIKIGLCNEQGEMISGFVFRKVAWDDRLRGNYTWSGDKGGLYDNNGRHINHINPLFVKNVEDDGLYLVTRSGPIRVCDYIGGKYYDKDGIYPVKCGLAEKKVIINFPLIQVCNRSIDESSVYKYECGKIKLIHQSKNDIGLSIGIKDISREPADVLEKRLCIPYLYQEDGGEFSLIEKSSGEKIKINGYKFIIYIGTSTKWGDLFLAKESSKGNWKGSPVCTKDGKCLYVFDYYSIDALSSDNKYIVVNSKSGYSYGLISVEGEVLLPSNYSSIKEIRTGLYKVGKRYDRDDTYYVVEDRMLCKELFDDFYLAVENRHFALVSRKTKKIVIDKCCSCHSIGKGIYTVDFDDNGNNRIVIDENGNKLLDSCNTIKDLGNGLYEIDNIIIDNKGKKYADYEKHLPQIPFINYSGSKKYGYDLVYVDENDNAKNILHYNGRIEQAMLLSNNLILIKTRNEGYFFVDNKGNTIIDKDKLYYCGKLSDKYFSAFEREKNEFGIYNMEGNLVFKGKYARIALIDY